MREEAETKPQKFALPQICSLVWPRVMPNEGLLRIGLPNLMDKGWSSEQPGLVEGVPSRGTGLELDDP